MKAPIGSFHTVASMRRLAKELGAGAMSLYWHIPKKDDLLDLMLDAAFGEVELPEPPSADWRADLRLFARHMLSALRRYPWLPSLISSDLQRYDEALAAHEQALSLDPASVSAWTAKHYALLDLGRNDEAIAAQRRAVELGPGDAGAWDTLIALLDRFGRHDEASAARQERDQALRMP